LFFSYSDRIFFFFRVMPKREFVTIFSGLGFPFKIGRHLFKRRRNIYNPRANDENNDPK
jgi:hypothetical protein